MQRRTCLQQVGVLAALCAGVGLWRDALARQTPLLALVIGNDRYQQNARLANAGRDADLVASVLQEMGAEVIRLRDASADRIRQRIVDLARRAAEQGAVAWVYYAGHGVQIDGRNYLQGVDADFSSPEQVRRQGLDLTWVSAMLTRDRLPAAVVLVDACRDNPFLPQTRGLDGHGLAPLEPQGLLIGYSTAPFKKALDGRQQPNGPYATALASVLRQRPMDLHKAMKSVAKLVFQNTGQQQVPWYSSSLRVDLVLEQRGVSLTHLVAASPVGPASTRANGTRSATSYRPDAPAVEPRREGADHWQRLEASLLSQQRSADAAVARRWVSKAGQGRSSEEDRLLAAMVLTDGTAGVQPDPIRAARLLSPLAQAGHAVAQTLLGELRYRQRDIAEAFRWFSAAAESGFTRARLNLADLTVRTDLANGQLTPDSLDGLFRAARQAQEQMRMPVPAPPGAN